jgi:hypothetical protein
MMKVLLQPTYTNNNGFGSTSNYREVEVDANNWEIDESNNLVLRKGSKKVAAFSTWVCVIKS